MIVFRLFHDSKDFICFLFLFVVCLFIRIFILIQKKSEVETQIEMMESLKKEIASTEQETKEMNLEHSNRYSRERAKNQDIEEKIRSGQGPASGNS